MPDRPALSRRAALSVGLAGLVAATGCEASEVLSPEESPSGSPVPGASGSPGSTVTSEAPDDPDAALVDEVAAALGEAAAVVAGAAAVPSFRTVLAGLTALHAAHLEVLEKAPPAVPSAGRARPEAAWTRVRAREAELQRQLAEWSVEARSGALAKLLAAMSAGVAQHLAVLPAQPPARKAR